MFGGGVWGEANEKAQRKINQNSNNDKIMGDAFFFFIF